jgi:basic membrane lipoprotein Med (substrate-binding protein (PBP1-ABC) superfamily)
MSPALENTAPNHPDQLFAIIGDELLLDNVASAIFEPAEGAFLAGIIGAFLAADDDIRRIDIDPVVGVIASVEEDPTVQDLVDGFIEGINVANDEYGFNITILDTVYLGGYNETQEAEDETYNMYTEYNATLIFSPVRAAITGIREGAVRANVTLWSNYDQPGRFNDDRMPLIIAAEGNQDYYGCANYSIPISPSWIATSVVLRSDLAIFQIVNATLWDVFPANELLTYDLSNNGVNITSFEYSSVYIPSEAITAFRYYHDSIINGTAWDQFL